jgi:hypothetical protein
MAKSDMKEDTKMDMAQDKKMAKKAIGMHDKQMHGGKKTDLATLKKGGGCAKTKKMAFGGMAGAIKNAVTNMPAPNPAMAKPAGAPSGRMIAAAPGAVNTTPNVRSTMMPARQPAGLGSIVKGSTGSGTIRRAKGGGIEVRGKTKGRMC